MAVLCIGIGNAFRQDDSVGLYVADLLRDRNLPGVHVRGHSREGISLLNTWEDAEAVILIDSVSSGAEPGMLYQFQAHKMPLPDDFFTTSTHTFGVGEAVELARTLDQLPSCCLVFGIEGQNFEPGTGLTPEVEAVVPLVVEMIEQTIEELVHVR